MTHDDDQLQQRLSHLVADVDPVPAVVREAARAALGWRRLDAELAELLGDSMLDSEALVLTRGTEAPLRSVTFGTQNETIDLEIVERGATRMLRGQLSPAAPAAVEVQRPDGEIAATVRCDELGRFLVEVDGGTVRLRVSDGVGPGPIETAWIGL